MKHYFEKTYPIRIAQLAKDLDTLTKKFEQAVDSTTVNEALESFCKEVNIFGENTKMHLAGPLTGKNDENSLVYLHMVGREYLIQEISAYSEKAGWVLDELGKMKEGRS